MMAALVAAHHGVDVLLLEKSVRKGTNAQLSGGFLQAARTRYQEALAIEDSPEQMMEDILTKNGGVANKPVVEAICRRSGDFVHFIADQVGLELHLNTTIRWYGHSAFRMHSGPGENGAELVVALRQAVHRQNRITFVDEARVADLLMEDGRVTGVMSAIGDGRTEPVTASAVVLACDGFGGNREMLAEHCPEALAAVYIGSENNVGDGIRWGLEVGAGTDFMSAWQGHPHVNPKHGTHLSGGLPYLGALIVNLNGERFAREDEGYSELTPKILAQPSGVAVEIFDQRIVDAIWENGIFRLAYDGGAVRRFGSVEEMAAGFGLSGAALVQTLERFNRSATGSEPDPLGRTTFGAPLEAPFYASLITGGLAHTQGGLRIDPTTQVQTAAVKPVPGLFAAGGTAAGMSGVGAAGYTSGNGLAHAFTTGLIAGESVTALVHPQALGTALAAGQEGSTP